MIDSRSDYAEIFWHVIAGMAVGWLVARYGLSRDWLYVWGFFSFGREIYQHPDGMTTQAWIEGVAMAAPAPVVWAII